MVTSKVPGRILSGRYPHLLSQDIPCWERFLLLYGSTYLRFDYDVHVGDGRDPGPQTPPQMRQVGIDLSHRRIDAIGYRPGETHIFEITRCASLKAVGQLISYPILYAHTFGPGKRLIPVLVCEEFHTDIDTVIKTLGVLHYVLPPGSEKV